MKYAFLFSGIIELLGAVVIYFYPEWMFEVDVTGVSKLYGMAVFALGLVNVFAYQDYHKNAFIKKNVLFSLSLPYLDFGVHVNFSFCKDFIPPYSALDPKFKKAFMLLFLKYTKIFFIILKLWFL